jgi:hypothetical protein
MVLNDFDNEIFGLDSNKMNENDEDVEIICLDMDHQ